MASVSDDLILTKNKLKISDETVVSQKRKISKMTSELTSAYSKCAKFQSKLTLEEERWTAAESERVAEEQFQKEKKATAQQRQDILDTVTKAISENNKLQNLERERYLERQLLFKKTLEEEIARMRVAEICSHEESGKCHIM